MLHRSGSEKGSLRVWCFSLLLTGAGSLAVFSCSTNARQAVLPQSFVYQGDFFPAFLSASSFTIQAHQNRGQLKLTCYQRQRQDTLRRVAFSDSVALSESDLRTFFAALDSVPLLKMAPKQQMGLDGVDVVNTVSQDGAHNRFQFWSPKKHTREHKLVEAVLGLARRKFSALPQREYFESLEEYFHFGLPCEITSTAPCEVRIHGVIYSDEEWLKNLQAFLQQLPTDQPVLIDMTNSRGMAWDCHPLFRKFLARNSRVVWVPSREALENLEKIGVPPGHIAKTVAEGRQLIDRL